MNLVAGISLLALSAVVVAASIYSIISIRLLEQSVRDSGELVKRSVPPLVSQLLGNERQVSDTLDEFPARIVDAENRMNSTIANQTEQIKISADTLNVDLAQLVDTMSATVDTIPTAMPADQ